MTDGDPPLPVPPRWERVALSPPARRYLELGKHLRGSNCTTSEAARRCVYEVMQALWAEVTESERAVVDRVLG